MSIKGNPAEKLYEILESAKKLSDKSNYDNNNSVKKVWALTFDIDEKDEEKVFFSVVQVIQQIEILKKVANRMNTDTKDDFIKEITKLEKEIMNLKLDSNSYQLYNIISDSKMMALKAIGMGLDVCNQYSNIDDEQINEIKERINELTKEINDLSINEDLKKAVIGNLSSVNLMIQNHKLYGTDAISGSVQKSFGSIMLNRDLSEVCQKDQTIKSTIYKILNLLGNINTMFIFGKNISPMLPVATDIIHNFLN